MKNSNIEEILPKELLFEIQKYAQGMTLYIPKTKDSRKRWGENTQSKNIVSMRNGEIRAAFHDGSSIDWLCDKYFLSPESIKKIVYSK
ncbi:MAG: CD3324 family protein [Oscillospiraceae bacterium]|nr:CD3324 family protein [Oscillospiraceae bacterium]